MALVLSLIQLIVTAAIQLIVTAALDSVAAQVACSAV
jgi:hypothetical protein